MRRAIELTILFATAGLLVATSQARQPCANEAKAFHAQTTCGPAADFTVALDSSCTINATGAQLAGLPTAGSSGTYVNDAGVMLGFNLTGLTPDGGNTEYCSAHPDGDGGLAIRCTPSCGYDAGACDPACSGTLTPQ